MDACTPLPHWLTACSPQLTLSFRPQVARIASEAMDGYMLLTQKLSSRVLAAREVHPQLFKGANRVFKQVRGSDRRT